MSCIYFYLKVLQTIWPYNVALCVHTSFHLCWRDQETLTAAILLPQAQTILRHTKQGRPEGFPLCKDKGHATCWTRETALVSLRLRSKLGAVLECERDLRGGGEWEEEAALQACERSG